MYPKILEISQSSGVPVANILDVLSILAPGKPVDNTDLIQRTGLSKGSLNQIKLALKNYLKPSSQNTQILPRYHKEVEALIINYSQQDNLYRIFENSDYKKALEVLLKYKKFIVKPERKYDQFIASRETVAKRAAALNFFGDLRGKNILFLGDDDFTSIGVAALGQVKLITVLDIDKKVLTRVKQIAQKENFNVKTNTYDARNDLLKQYKGNYDVVFTDPPYTPEGIELFVNRGLDSLNPRNKAGRIYFCYGGSDQAKERFVPISDIIARLGLCTRYVFDKFSHYKGAEAIGSSSNLYICEATSRTQNSIKGVYGRKIYTYN